MPSGRRLEGGLLHLLRHQGLLHDGVVQQVRIVNRACHRGVIDQVLARLGALVDRHRNLDRGAAPTGQGRARPGERRLRLGGQ